MDAHFEILPQAQKDIWPMLSPCKELHFVLYGGTAISLHLGHRYSVDFDFFSSNPLDERVEQIMLATMPFLNRSQIIQRERNTRSYITDAQVKLSFFGGINFGRVGEPCFTEDNVAQVASVKDLIATKLAVLTQRVEAKDYIDIAAILRHGIKLEHGLSCAMALYGKQFSPIDSFKALTYFEGPDLHRLSIQDKEMLINTAKLCNLHNIQEAPILSEVLSSIGTLTEK